MADICIQQSALNLIAMVSVQPPSADAAPVVKAKAIPVVTISYALRDLTLASFSNTLKTNLVAAIVAALPKRSNVRVYLTNIRAASVLFDTVVQFLDGDNNMAQALSNSIATSATVSLLLLQTFCNHLNPSR